MALQDIIHLQLGIVDETHISDFCIDLEIKESLCQQSKQM